MQSIVMQVRINDPSLVHSINQGELDDADQHIAVSLAQQIPKESATGIESSIATVVVSFSVSLTASVLGAWLYDKFKSRAKDFTINGEIVEIEVTKITEKIKIQFNSHDAQDHDNETPQ